MPLKLLWSIPTFFLFLSVIPAKLDAETMDKTFRNPILTGFNPDPTICRVGEDFYLSTSTFEFFPGLPIHHSRDLVHWEQVGNALDRPSQLPLKGATDSSGLYAPTLRYWKGTFYLICCNVNGGGNFIVTAKDPKGPWSEPVWLGDHGIDGSLFFDDDGKIYCSRVGMDGVNGTMVAEVDPKTLKLASEFKKIWEYPGEWNEGPHLYKINGLYYLISATGGTETNHQEVAARAKNVWGPYEACPENPILTQRDDPKSPIQCAGHADLVEAPDGTWWAVFLGTRPQDGLSVLGRETFLAPVTWKDGWPIVGNNHHVALEMTAPKLKPFAATTPEPRTDFDGDRLGPEWLHIRNYDPKNLSLKERKGYLWLRTAKDGLDSRWEEPAFAGQRQPSFRFSARTAMEFRPGQDGEEAGLCVRANEGNHYEVGIGQFGGKPGLFVRNRIKNREYMLFRGPVGTDKVQLEISGTEDRYQFAWSKDGETWTSLAASSSADLSREKAGGFTGAVVGLYATAKGKTSGNHADFDWFEMLPGVVPEKVAITRRSAPTPLVASAQWRILADRESFRDRQGREWSYDLGYEGGETARSWHSIDGAEDAMLYQFERYGKDFGYTLPVVPGKYRVRLLFAETFMKKEGGRVFDVLINGKKVLENFDILKEAIGFGKALDKEFKGVEPDDQGNIHIRFVARTQDAKVCGFEILKEE